MEISYPVYALGGFQWLLLCGKTLETEALIAMFDVTGPRINY